MASKKYNPEKTTRKKILLENLIPVGVRVKICLFRQMMTCLLNYGPRLPILSGASLPRESHLLSCQPRTRKKQHRAETLSRQLKFQAIYTFGARQRRIMQKIRQGM